MFSDGDLGGGELFRIGGTTVSVGGVVAGLAIFIAAWVLSRIVRHALCRVRERATREAAAIYLLEKLLTYGLVVAGALIGLSTAGLNLTSLGLFAGAIGIGLGLGLQGVVKEFVSGVFLIFDRMVSVGDYVELDQGVRGMIVEIGPRATRIRTNDNINILVPNSQLIERRVTNWTLKGDTRRIHIPFAVAYGADRAKVRDAVLEAARASPFTLPETPARRSQVWLVGFGESGLDFELLVWPTRDAVKRPAAMHAAYTWLIADALEAAGVEIPFPQTDLRLRSVFGREGDEALKALGLDAAGSRRTRHPAKGRADADPGVRAPPFNDAAEDVMAPPQTPDDEEDDPLVPPGGARRPPTPA
jgi:small-conductance mechanosensitive channel